MAPVVALVIAVWSNMTERSCEGPAELSRIEHCWPFIQLYLAAQPASTAT
jgi:hypothetical protein